MSNLPDAVDPMRLPPNVRRLWGLHTASRLGRRADLDVGQVIQAAIAIADAEGLAAVTMSRVAKNLGYTTMSLYRHVGSKDELVTLIWDVAAGLPPDDLDVPGDWRAGLTRWAHAVRHTLTRRDWMVDVSITGPPIGPHQLAWMEAAVRPLRGTGLLPYEKLGVATLINGFAGSEVALRRGLTKERTRLGVDDRTAEEEYGRTLAALVTAERFPELSEIVGAGTFDMSGDATADLGPTADDDFTFGLDRILDGIDVLIRSRADSS